MRCNAKLWFISWALLVACPAWSQSPEAQKPAAAEPATQRYANMPVEAVPYGKFTKPYKEWFLTDDTLAYNGAARDRVSQGNRPLQNRQYRFPRSHRKQS